MKKTAIAPSNIAFVKYWGKKDDILRLPSNGSISMNLSGLLTTTTVEFSAVLGSDEVTIDGVRETSGRVGDHLDRIRKLAGIATRAKVVSRNTFPSSTGLSASASGFAALSVAAAAAAGLNLHEKELSILARQGSGSACRSIPSGFVEWLDGDTSESSYSVSLAPPSFWDIADVVAIVSSEKKEVATTQGQQRTGSSIFFPVRLQHMREKIARCKTLLSTKNFEEFGSFIEEEALEMHAVMLTSRPPLMYWLPTTVQLMREVKKWRNEGLMVYFTINTGQDVHLICRQADSQKVAEKLQTMKEVKRVIINTPGEGARLTQQHLF